MTAPGPALVVYVEPTFGPADRAWIDGIRAAHDPNARVVGPHATLVYPAPGFARAETFGHVAAAARTAPPFGLGFAGVKAERAADGSGVYLYLMATTGAAELRTLRERLLIGPLANANRMDIPYEPHVTLGRFREFDEAERIARRLDAEGRSIKSIATEATAVAYDGKAIRDIRRTPLGR